MNKLGNRSKRRKQAETQGRRERLQGVYLDGSAMNALCANTRDAEQARDFLKRTDPTRHKQVVKELARRNRA